MEGKEEADISTKKKRDEKAIREKEKLEEKAACMCEFIHSGRKWKS